MLFTTKISVQLPLIALSFLSLLTSCGAPIIGEADTKPVEKPTIPDKQINVTLTDRYTNQTNNGQFVAFDTLRSNVVCYLVEGDVVKSISTDGLTALVNRTVAVSPELESDFFVVYRGTVCNNLYGIKVGSPRSDLLKVAVNELSSSKPNSIAMSGVVHIKPDLTDVHIDLKRVYSRVDLTLQGVQVYGVRIAGVQTSGYVFAESGVKADGVKKEFRVDFAPAETKGVKAFAYLFEQPTKDLYFEFDCAVVGSSTRQKMKVAVPYAAIERNNIYSISLVAADLNPGPPVDPDQPVDPPKPPVDPDEPVDPPTPPVVHKITAKFELLPWNSEDVDAGYPELGQPVEIDPKFSYDTRNVSFNAATRTINVSYHGSRLEIPFTGNIDKLVTLQNANSNVTLTPVPNTKYKNERVVVAVNQPAESPAYSFEINVKNALTSGPGTTYKVNVDRSSYPSVIMGGIEWLTFNSGSGKDHPRLELGQTVRGLYKSSWGDFVYMCQWGERPNPTIFKSPTVANAALGQNPAGNLLDQAAGLTWTKKLPCPAGWRLPTIAELWRIWPLQGLGVNLSGVTRYVVSNISYTAQVQESEAVYEYGGAAQPTRLLVIKQGDNELLFPLAGYRPRDDYNSGSKHPVEPGVSGFYWSDVIGVQTYNARVKGLSNGSSWNGDGYNKFELYGSWNMVRCVRNLK